MTIDSPTWVAKCVLTSDQFKEIAQMELVLSYAAGLSMVVQLDTWGSLAHYILCCLRVHVIYHTKIHWAVAKVDMYHNTSNQWHASSTSPCRPLLPRIQVAQLVKPRLEEVQLVKVKHKGPMATPKLLTERMRIELTDPQLLALACHPLAATLLDIMELEDLLYYLSVKSTCKSPLQKWKNRAKEVLTKEIKRVWHRKLAEDDSSEEDVAPKKPVVDSINDYWKQVMENAPPKKAAEAPSGCKVKKEVGKFFSRSLIGLRNSSAKG